MKKIFFISLLFVIITSCSNDEPDEPVILSEENSITSFKLNINGEIVGGVISQTEKTITFNTVGADLNSLIPIIQYSSKATISPAANIPQNFNNEVAYTVYAENGDPSIYRVIVSNRPLSSENKILSFTVVLNNETINATIDQDKKLISFNAGSYDVSSLIPTISISEYATISPNNEAVQNFTNQVTYTVTAENGNQSIYTCIVNPPKIYNYTNSTSPLPYYIRADYVIVGAFINPEVSGAEVYLTDGTNKYLLPILEFNSFEHGNDSYVTDYRITTKIPENVPTYNNYKIVYKVNNYIAESEQAIDILAENAPKPITLNQQSYQRNDILIITGENLPDMIAIPSNGSIFLIENSNNYDLTVNSDRTELRLTLDYYYLFPSYFARDPEEKTITMVGPNRRWGESIKAIFE